MLIGLLGAITIRLAVYLKSKNTKKYRKGKEYGSARWGNRADIKPFINSDFSKNIILTQTEQLTLEQISDPEKRNVNHNVLVIGSSGSGKTRYHVKPNLMQMNASYIVTDPKGTVLLECGNMLARHGYIIRVLNTIRFSESMHYNPFAYVHSETDVLRLVTVLMQNTKGEDTRSGEEFWTKAEALLYQALIGYVAFEAPAEERNFLTLLDLINKCEVREDDEDFQSPVDLLFEQLAIDKPHHFAVRQYAKFKLAAGKTMKSILVACGARLAPFDIEEVRKLLTYDEMSLDKLGDRKTALFCIVSDTDPAFNFISAMLYSQMFNTLCDKALEKGGRLPVHVTCLLDEFANQKIPNFQHLISVIRSRNISAHIIMQTQSQLKAVYKEHAETIIGNCSSILFLGGKEPSTLRSVSESLGRETIDTYSESDTRGNQRSHGLNYTKLGKPLMTPDELAVMPGSRCILQIQGVHPFYSRKYDITKHPMYAYLSDADERNAFDVGKYLKRRLRVNPQDVYAVNEVTISSDNNQYSTQHERCFLRSREKKHYKIRQKTICVCCV
jgi:type IV secretion system protein VirD4